MLFLGNRKFSVQTILVTSTPIRSYLYVYVCLSIKKSYFPEKIANRNNASNNAMCIIGHIVHFSNNLRLLYNITGIRQALNLRCSFVNCL